MTHYTSPTPVPDFLDPDDPTLFPRLTAAQIEQLAERAETLSLSPGDVLFEQGQRDTPFFVVLSGAIDVIDRQPDGDHYFTQCQPGTFAADISMFTGEPTLARVSSPRTARFCPCRPMSCARWWPVPPSWATCSCAR